MNNNEISQKKDLKLFFGENDDFFQKNKYILIKNLCNPSNIFCDLPKERGKFEYFNQDYKNYINYGEDEDVKGCLSRYNYPKFKKLENQIKLIVEEIIGKKLSNVYYYDRYYFPGQQLKKQINSNICEISITINVSTNMKKNYPFCIQNLSACTNSKKNKEVSLYLKPGDAVLYSENKISYWRPQIPYRKRNIIRKLFKQKELYYHDLTFHYNIIKN